MNGIETTRRIRDAEGPNLDVRDRAAAIVYAYRHGIASPPGTS
jgi:hypothetical protein